MKSSRTIYLDHAATTPMDRSVVKAMHPYFTKTFYNPGGIYRGAEEAKAAIETARKDIADILHARTEEIIFTDGGTEANNLAIQGVVHTWLKKFPDQKPHIITTAIEHASVLEVYTSLESVCDVTYLPVNQEGYINIKELKEALKENTILVSVGYVNGEIGTIQDIKEIAKTIRHTRKQNQSNYPLFHTDAIQAMNCCNMNVLQLGVDLLTISGSKIYGPKKIAALYIKEGTELTPLIHGGDQEQSLRPGTENVPYIVGLAKAITKAEANKEKETKRLHTLKEYFIHELSTIPDIILNSPEAGAPHIVNITILGISSEELVIRLDAYNIAASMKSACKSGEDGDSHVILALRNHDTGSIRFSFGRGTTKKELTKTITILKNIIQQMKNTKNLYS